MKWEVSVVIVSGVKDKSFKEGNLFQGLDFYC